MQDNFFKNCINLFRLTQNHLLSPSKAMSTESLEENFGGEDANRKFIIPMATVLAIAQMASSALWSENFSMAATVYLTIVAAISPVLIYFMIKIATAKILELFDIREETEKKARVITLQLMLLYFAVEFICYIIPGANLLHCLYVYAFYMIWFVAGEYLGVTEHQRIKFMLSEMAVCAVALFILPFIMKFITPRHP